MRTKVNYDINQGAINHFFLALSRGNKKSLEILLKLNPLEQYECTKVSNVGRSYALYNALSMGYPLDLIKHLIWVNEDSDLLKDSESIFGNLFHSPKKFTNVDSNEILSFFLDYFEKNHIAYDLRSALLKAMSSNEDNTAAYFLNLTQNLLYPSLRQELLNAACEEHLLPQCITKLVSLGAKLPSIGEKEFENFLKSKIKINNKSLSNFLKLVADNQSQISVTHRYFLQGGSVKYKKLILESAFKNCNKATLLKLEDAFQKAGNVISGYSSEKILLDHVKIIFDKNPNYKIFNPEKISFIAFHAMRTHDALIHTLLKRGLTLNQLVSAYHGTYPLAAAVAYYSKDLKLIKKLKNIRSVDSLGRTPSHYALFAISENSTKKTLLKFNMEMAFIFRSGIDSVKKAFPYFKFMGSKAAFENSNLGYHAQVADIFDCTPLDYAAMLTNSSKKAQILQSFTNLLFPSLMEILNFIPKVLINMIAQYIVFNNRDTDFLIIEWLKILLKKTHLLSVPFHLKLSDSLKSCLTFDDNQELIRSSENAVIARIALMAFNSRTMVVESSKENIIESTNSTLLSSTSFSSDLSDTPELAESKLPIPRLPSSPSCLNSLSPYSFLNRANHSYHFDTTDSMNLLSPPAYDFKHSGNVHGFLPPIGPSQKSSIKNNKKRVRFQEETDFNWKEHKLNVVQSIKSYCQGGMRKQDLESALQPFLQEIENAKNSEELKVAITKMKDSLADTISDFDFGPISDSEFNSEFYSEFNSQPNSERSLSEIADAYGIKKFLEDILEGNSPKPASFHF